jgi:hypothetical protein
MRQSSVRNLSKWCRFWNAVESRGTETEGSDGNDCQRCQCSKQAWRRHEPVRTDESCMTSCCELTSSAESSFHTAPQTDPKPRSTARGGDIAERTPTLIANAMQCTEAYLHSHHAHAIRSVATSFPRACPGPVQLISGTGRCVSYPCHFPCYRRKQ